jgi:hypothetical protein
MNWRARPINHFTLGEARCHGWEGEGDDKRWHDCGLIILVRALCICLEHTRSDYGKPIRVNSWSRCRPHNLAIGGKDDSYHQNGRAIDIAPVDMDDMDTLEEIARRYFPFVKRYSWGLHCDIRGERP